MSRLLLILANDDVRARAVQMIAEAPEDQNARLWAMLGDVASQVTWHGLKLTSEDWKDIFTASLRRELRTVPNLEGTGFVVLGMRTSDMTVAEFADLMTVVEAFGAQHGVTFHEPARRAA
jgi:hypothetical protein